MKGPGLALGATLLACLSAAGQKPESFTGEISDRDCVEMAGHEMMLKKGETANDCTITCVKLGKYVLYDGASKIVYQLDDQKKPEPFAGSKVKVSGTYDAPTKTIHVQNIQPVS